MQTAIILDVDTGMDDALALGLAVLDPRVELVAATTVAGNVGIDHTTRNTLTVLDWFSAPDVAVFRGASHPLARALQTAAQFQGDDGLGESALEPSKRRPRAEPAPAAIIRLARQRPGDITLVCAGPLTNLAIALSLDPTLPTLLAGLVIMGGAFVVPGNITDHAEFNIFCDPEAAAQVFHLADQFNRFTAIGLEVCHQVALRHADYLACQAAESPGGRLVARVARRQFGAQPATAFYLYDPLALAVAVSPALVRSVPAEVMVDLDSPHLGRTRIVGTGPVQVVTEVDAATFLSDFREVLALPRGEDRTAG